MSLSNSRIGLRSVQALRADGRTGFVIAVDWSSPLVGPAVAKITAEKQYAYNPGMMEIVLSSSIS